MPISPSEKMLLYTRLYYVLQNCPLQYDLFGYLKMPHVRVSKNTALYICLDQFFQRCPFLYTYICVSNTQTHTHTHTHKTETHPRICTHTHTHTHTHTYNRVLQMPLSILLYYGLKTSLCVPTSGLKTASLYMLLFYFLQVALYLCPSHSLKDAHLYTLYFCIKRHPSVPAYVRVSNGASLYIYILVFRICPHICMNILV